MSFVYCILSCPPFSCGRIARSAAWEPPVAVGAACMPFSATPLAPGLSVALSAHKTGGRPTRMFCVVMKHLGWDVSRRHQRWRL
jgi:hypothetical protein